ncbi:MAG: hypothetical protein IIB57_00535, partial [Planctomycetes bacterium]|nr:hypothetical protein [Planctomycetota bacterium]
KFCEQDSDCAGDDCFDLLTQVEECVVLSDTFEPDSDFDGLSDLLEKLIHTNPKDPDTDGDNLLDSDELDPRSRFSVDPSLFRLFENKCLEATRCVSFDTDASQAFGTSLKAVDTDGDGRNDLEELFVSWTINVVGQDSYRVFSDPLEADFDADGLNDFEEQNADKPTDPTKADTDNDSVSDFRETEPGGPNTNPLEADQKILVNIASITVIGNCDDNDIGEFRGKIFVQASGVDQQELHSFGDMREGAVINPPAVIPFTIREGDTIIVFSNAIREEDSNPDEQLGSFQEFFNFPISGQLKAVELTDGEDSCKLLIVIQLRWIR